MNVGTRLVTSVQEIAVELPRGMLAIEAVHAQLSIDHVDVQI